VGRTDRAHALHPLHWLELHGRGTLGDRSAPAGRVSRPPCGSSEPFLGGGSSPNTHTVAADAGIRKTGLQEPNCAEKNWPKCAGSQRAITTQLGESARSHCLVCRQFRIRNLCIFTCFLCVSTESQMWPCTLVLLPCRIRLSLPSERGTVQAELILSSADLSAGIGCARKT
jgi:hypothetical protein